METREENAVVLDFLPNGYSFDKRPSHIKTSIAQAIGKENFVVLELVPRKEVHLQPQEEVYIGDGKRDKIHHIAGKIPLSKLTQTAASEMEVYIQTAVHRDQARFIEFFNKAQPLSMRMHQLELLPGLGKKHMWEVLEQRGIEPFKDFNDLKKRVKLLPNPEKSVAKRIMKELEGNEKHNLFIQP